MLDIINMRHFVLDHSLQFISKKRLTSTDFIRRTMLLEKSRYCTNFDCGNLNRNLTNFFIGDNLVLNYIFNNFSQEHTYMTTCKWGVDTHMMEGME